MESCSNRFSSHFSDDKFSEMQYYFAMVISSAESNPFYKNVHVISNHKTKDLKLVTEEFDKPFALSCGKYSQVFNSKEKKYLTDFFERGYANGASAMIFPYMIPDNSSLLAGILFDPVLYRSTVSSNKSKPVLRNLLNLLEQNVEQAFFPKENN